MTGQIQGPLAGWTVKGVDQAAARLRAMADKFPLVSARALYEEALIEEKESRSRTPVEFGPLRASHVTTPPLIDGRTITVKIVVGGPSAPYAPYVHEDLEAEHPNGGQAKFLESTIDESRPYMAARVGRRIDFINNVARLV